MVLPRRLLDDAVAETLQVAAPWRRAALAPVVALVVVGVLVPVVIVVGNLPRHGDAVGAYGLVAELLFGAAVVAVASPVARRYGGWGPAFGLAKPVRSDLKRVLGWLCLQIGARAGLAILLSIVVPDLPSAGNLTEVDELGPAGGAMLLAAAVVVAPILEEVAFRGLMLRALMRRLTFWPSAGISSFVFALLHAPGATTLPGAGALVLYIYVFGLIQCQLVRRTGRLAPAIGVHAALNLLATVTALAVS
jgi:membrane protease YdiL (CAAX protease family)